MYLFNTYLFEHLTRFGTSLFKFILTDTNSHTHTHIHILIFILTYSYSFTHCLVCAFKVLSNVSMHSMQSSKSDKDSSIGTTFPTSVFQVLSLGICAPSVSWNTENAIDNFVLEYR